MSEFEDTLSRKIIGCEKYCQFGPFILVVCIIIATLQE